MMNDFIVALAPFRGVNGKALLDLLVKHRVIDDDTNVVAISSAWSADVPAGRVLVAIKRARGSLTCRVGVAAIVER
jgi:hypothetical protein